MKVTVLSKKQFDDALHNSGITDDSVEIRVPHIGFICICSTEHPEAGWESQPYFQRDHPNVLRMWFDDVTKDVAYLQGTAEHTYRAFTEEQAREVIAFLETQRLTNIRELIVHCTGGINRSGSVGEFAHDYLGGDYATFQRHNPYAKRNPTVTATLNRVWRETQN